MRFDFTDDQKAIKQSARDMLARRYPSATLHRLADAGAYDDAHWSEMVTLGWPGLAVDERWGGVGMGMLGLVVLLEEMGRALAASPFLSNAAATLLLQSAGDDRQCERWLPRVVSGEARLGVVLTGSHEQMLGVDVEAADAVVVVGGDRTASLAERVEATPVATIDRLRRFSRVAAVNGGEALPGDVARALDLVEIALAAELVGVGQRALEMAVDHARNRVQFGKVIGTYQAVSHRCAEILRSVESARSATYHAAWAAGAAPEILPLAASCAKASAAEGGWNAVASSLQVHGGIGFTWEHDLHLFLKRAAVDGRLLGSAAEHHERVASLSGLGAAATSPQAQPAGVGA